jgi:hypothetical protein
MPIVGLRFIRGTLRSTAIYTADTPRRAGDASASAITIRGQVPPSILPPGEGTWEPAGLQVVE